MSAIVLLEHRAACLLGRLRAGVIIGTCYLLQACTIREAGRQVDRR